METITKFPASEYEGRYQRLRGLTGEAGLDAVVVTNHQNVNYFAGIGLELAEQPSLDANSDVVLKPGMTLAFEPAILDECGLFDMEEDILITEDGCEVLAPVWPR